MLMEIADSVAAMRQARRRASGTVGFVPTMGYLHEGHLTLVKWARSQTDMVVVSIFVNPTQFGPGEDLAQYPRDPQRDLALLEKEGTDIVFMPTAADMYPAGFGSGVDVEKITERLEGAFRPGHFRGVATVVAKLFNIVEPHKAYFGAKDAQQLRVIQKMVTDLDMNLEIVPVPTVREPDGLAMSSRNTYLSPEERQAALVLYRSLALARELYAQGERHAEAIRSQVIELIQKEPRARIDYVSIADSDTLEELDKIEKPALASLAVRIGQTRLIDNMMLGGN